MPTREPAGRRARMRDATIAEIKATARALLVRDGPEALTLRAIAREMGMSAPALYRYFDSHDDLVRALCEETLAEITVAVETARDAAPLDDPPGRLAAASRGFRTWALAHPREFQFTFATMSGHPPIGHEHDLENGGDLSFGAVFLELFAELWARQPFPVPDETDLPPELVAQLREFSARIGDHLPLGVLMAYVSGWVRLYGAVTIEVFGHLGFALADPGPMFEAMLADMRRQLTTPP